MSKIVLAIAVIIMMMTTATLVGAEKDSVQKESGIDSNTATESSKPDKGISEVTGSGKVTEKAEAGREYIIRAWGKYGPIWQGQGTSAWYRIYYPGRFIGQPSVVDSLAVGWPDYWTVYSLGRDRGYSVLNRFDARLMVHSGSVSDGYIDWIAIRG